jgi:hypothetical protein
MKTNHFMRRNLWRFPALAALSALIAGAGPLAAQEAAVSTVEEMRILTRGPVHEAFAELITLEPEPGIIVTSAPPELIEELPPEHQLAGENVEWIPGYWAWDEDTNDFIWISGIWRNLPPSRQWVPGYWSDLGNDRYQWTSGYWADTEVEEITYVQTAPPRSIDVGPNIAAPAEDHSWVPGNWVWVERRYVWRPGRWLQFRPDWSWIPARHCWTPRGYVYVDGYWDYAIANRGVLFAPVHFGHHVYSRPHYRYTPSVVVALEVFTQHLFARPRCGHYYFGDYYASSYRRGGYYPSYAWHSNRRGYDPIFAHDRWRHRGDRGWESRRSRDYDYFRDHAEARPPRTWAAMRELRGDRSERGFDRRFARSLDEYARSPERASGFRSIDKDRRERFAEKNREIRSFRGERQRVESSRPSRRDDDSRQAVARERISRSPIASRSAERLSRTDSPPARPTARELRSELRSDQVRTPNREAFRSSSGERERATSPGIVRQRPEIRGGSEERARASSRESVRPQPQIERESRGRATVPSRESVRPQPQIERESRGRATVPSRESVRPQPQIQRSSPSRATAPSRQSARPQPQIQRSAPSRATAPSRQSARPQPQIQRSAPSRATAPSRQSARPQPQIQRSAPSRATAPSRQSARPQPQIQRSAPSRATAPSRQSARPQPQIQRSAPSRTTAPSRQSVRPQPQIRRAPERRTQSAPQRSSSSSERESRSSERQDRRGGR